MGRESGSGKTGSLNNRPCWSKNEGKLRIPDQQQGISESFCKSLLEHADRHRFMGAWLGCLPAKWGEMRRSPATGKHPFRELKNILAMLGVNLVRREGTSIYPQNTDFSYTNHYDSEGKPKRTYFYEITTESWIEIERWVESRNSGRTTELIPDPISADPGGHPNSPICGHPKIPQ